MVVRNILLLGNSRLYEKSEIVKPEEISNLKDLINDLHDTMMNFQKIYGVGRAIAASQIGIFKRLIYMNIDNQETVIINPILEKKSDEMFEVWDDCMSFPDLLVKVLRHKTSELVYQDLEWKEQRIKLEDDLSELLQHEIDHLDGVLATQRAINKRAFAYRTQRKFLD